MDIAIINDVRGTDDPATLGATARRYAEVTTDAEARALAGGLDWVRVDPGDSDLAVGAGLAIVRAVRQWSEDREGVVPGNAGWVLPDRPTLAAALAARQAAQDAAIFVEEFPGQSPDGDWDAEAFSLGGLPAECWHPYSDYLRTEVCRRNRAAE